MLYDFADKDRIRVIVNTDAKNEADDQYAIVHALLTPYFDIRGLISAHFGTRRSETSEQESYDEILLLLKLMDWEGRVRVEHGASHGLPDEQTPVPSPGAQLIIEEALKDDERPLFVAFYGPLTDMAAALLMEPRIDTPKVKVIWIGGGAWPLGGYEFNLSNDIHAANVVLASQVEVWQIPSTVYRTMGVSYAELFERVHPHGELGRYLVEQVIEFNNRYNRSGPIEYRSLGDSPAVGVMMYPECGRWRWQPAPQFEPSMHYRHTGEHRPIRVYDDMNTRFIHEDFFAKLAQWARQAERS
ncbi:MAG: nucleoside hydrolase [Anaerolineales bacterium]|nr:nucleoside hydrolase [Anaerolineales bacterium]MCB8962316.1 nucleoside hydrolase [Ardenticatenales bacterium]